MTEAAFHSTLVLSFLAIALAVFGLLLFITAPYGRHTRGGWGPSMPTRLAWVIMELPSVAVFALCIALAAGPVTAPEIVLGALWLGHYIHRTFIFPHRMRGGGRPTPVLIAASGFAFNVGNAYLNGRWIYTLGPGYTDAWLSDPRFLVGAALFALGFAINYHADRVLANLRRPGESGYKVPRGGLYAYVSCPNYFGELLEWTGFAIAAWSLPAVAFAVWTAANLVPRARSHHRWYLETFPEYPRERKVLIPGVY